METNIMQRMSDERDTYSILETVNIHTGMRTTLKEFEDVIEAPNWTSDGRCLVYNRLGHIALDNIADGIRNMLASSN